MVVYVATDGVNNSQSRHRPFRTGGVGLEGNMTPSGSDWINYPT